VKIKIGFVPSVRMPRSHVWGGPMRERTIKALAGVPGLELVVPGEDVTPHGLVQNDDQARATIRYFQDQQVDGVILGGMDFADEISAATVAAGIGKPTLLFATKEGALMSDGERASDAFCGALSIGVALHRRKLPFVAAGVVWPEERKFLESVESFVRACAALKGFTGARVGQIGVRPERFETVAFNEPLLLDKFGQKVVPIEISVLAAAGRAIPESDPDLKRVIDEMTGEVTTLNVSHKSLVALAQYELAIVRWMRERDLTAVAHGGGPSMRTLLGISTWSVLGRLADKGLLAAVETDILGALDMIPLYNAALKQTVPFHMDWTIQHRTRPNVFLAWHPGNGPISLAAPGSNIILRNRWRALDAPIPDDETGAGTYEFPLRLGDITMVRLMEYDGVYKMLITKGEVIEDKDPELQVGGWVQVADLDKLYSTLYEEGFIHHASLIYGDLTKPIEQFCKFAGIKTVIV
jgi:L-fucose isomerase-like protein